MSMPEIPDIKPDIKIKREEVVDLILASIGLEELSLAHLLNAEAEKLQYILKSKPSYHDLLKANRSIEKALRGSIKKQMLLQFKLEDVIDYLLEHSDCHKKHHEHENDHEHEHEHNHEHEHDHEPKHDHHHGHHHHHKYRYHEYDE